MILRIGEVWKKVNRYSNSLFHLILWINPFPFISHMWYQTIYVLEIATKASIASGSKNVEKKQSNDDFWGSANNSQQDSSTKVRSSTIKTNQMKEIDQGGWDDWNDNSLEGKKQYQIFSLS